MSCIKKSSAIVALMGSALFSTSALAVDLPEPVQPSWTGFYIGGLLGGGAVVHEFDIPEDDPLFTFNGIGGEGIIGGGMVGYNFQLTPSIVAGVQFDGLLTGISTDLTVDPQLLDIDADITLNHVLAISGRLGYLINPDTLAYIIAGYSWGEFEADLAIAGNNVGSLNVDVEGIHIGGGLEAKLSDKVTARVEYRYIHFNEEGFLDGVIVAPGDNLLGIEPSVHVGMVGLAYNLWAPGDGMIAEPAADFEPMNVADWTGFYVGGQLGGGAVVHELHIPADDPLVEFNGIGGEGFLGGLMAGYNMQLNGPFVLGLQVDWHGSDVSTDVSLDLLPLFAADASIDLEHMVAVSGRAGYLLNPDALFYILGGYTHGWFEASVTASNAGGPIFAGSLDRDLSGFHVGAGLEGNITENLRARAEYRYVHFEEAEFLDGVIVPPGDNLLGINPSLHMGTVGLAWVF